MISLQVVNWPIYRLSLLTTIQMAPPPYKFQSNRISLRLPMTIDAVLKTPISPMFMINIITIYYFYYYQNYNKKKFYLLS